ncbi:MAG: YqeG family HAD IIIA-type phosphatase [Oscillospiraceae bacterium]|nr:YqeG family HAD IIIA-type phosphatase [Oscillospiraceae bacterium]
MLRPSIAVRSVCDITPKMLQKMHVKGLLLDIDNTLTTHDNPEPAPGVERWIARMKENGIRLRIVSNNHPPRVEPFAERLGIPCICDGKKPLSDGFSRATADMGLTKDDVCVVGDQLYTDILGANLFGCLSIFTHPIAPESWKKQTFIRVKRIMEKPFLPKRYFGRDTNKE